MSIIKQRKRILIDNFDEPYGLKNFMRYITVDRSDLYGNVINSWAAACEVMYKNRPYLALPLRTDINKLDDFLVDDGPVIVDKTPAIESTKVTFKMDAQPRDNLQIDMTDFLIGRGKHKDMAKKIKKALFSETGSGKTFCSIYYFHSLGVLPFINCPDDKAIKTWKDEFFKFTDITDDEIAVVAGYESLPKIIKKKERYKVILGSSKTFTSLINNNEHNDIINFFEEMGVGILAHDEAHLNLYVMFMLEVLCNTKHTLFLTATPERRIYKENKILHNLLPPENSIYQTEPEERFELFYGQYYSSLNKDDYKGTQKPRGPDFRTYSKKVSFAKNGPFHHVFMKDVILQSVLDALSERSKLKDTGKYGKVAILGGSLAENDIIEEYLRNNITDYKIGRFDTTIKNIEERYLELDSDIIVSTDKSFNGIINIPDLETIISVYPFGGAYMKQIMGRIRNEEKRGKRSVVVQLVDKSCKAFSKAAYRQKRDIEEICASIDYFDYNSASEDFEEYDED